MTPETLAPIAYATPVRKESSRTAAAFAVVFAGLALIFLGGCFLIGVMMLVDSAALALAKNTSALSSAQLVLCIVLYACTFGCMGGGVYLLFLGTRGLLRIMNQK